MKQVIALEMGIYEGHRVRKGVVLSVPDNFRAKWVKEVGEVKPAPKPAPVAETLSALAKVEVKTDVEVRKEIAEAAKVDVAEIFRDLAPTSTPEIPRTRRMKPKGDGNV